MLKAYSSYFASFLLNNLKNTEKIERIILFGSVAKEEAAKDSDIDIFIEVNKKTSKIEKEIRAAEKDFYESREALLFKTKGINNKFSIKIGILKQWKELYRSIASTGIILYGKYEAKELPHGVKHFIILYWDKIGKNRGAFLNKIYGFSLGKKHYDGLLVKFSGKRIGKSCIMIPIYYKEEFFKLIREYEVSAKSIEIFV